MGCWEFLQKEVKRLNGFSTHSLLLPHIVVIVDSEWIINYWPAINRATVDDDDDG